VDDPRIGGIEVADGGVFHPQRSAAVLLARWHARRDPGRPADKRHRGGGRADGVPAADHAGARIDRHQCSGTLVRDPDAAGASRDGGRRIPDRHGRGDGVARGIHPGQRPVQLVDHPYRSIARGDGPGARADPDLGQGLTGGRIDPDQLAGQWLGDPQRAEPHRHPARGIRQPDEPPRHPAAGVDGHDRVAVGVGHPHCARASGHRGRAPADADRLDAPRQSQPVSKSRRTVATTAARAANGRVTHVAYHFFHGVARP